MVVKAQLRLATTDEAAAHEVNGKDMAMTADTKCDQDMTGAPPPAIRQPAAVAPVLPPWQNLPSAVRTLRNVPNAEKGKEMELEKLLNNVAQKDPTEAAVAQVPLALPEPLRAISAMMADAPVDGRFSAQRRWMMLDDMPQSVKKSKVGAAQLPYLYKTQEIEALDEGPGVARDAEKVPGYRTGLTIFYEERSEYEVPSEADTLNQVYLLKLKNYMKELDQKVVDQKVEQAFGEADAAEGTQRLASDTVVIVREKKRTRSYGNLSRRCR